MPQIMGPFLELAELLHRLAGTGEDTEDVEADLRGVSVLWLSWEGMGPAERKRAICDREGCDEQSC